MFKRKILTSSVKQPVSNSTSASTNSQHKKTFQIRTLPTFQIHQQTLQLLLKQQCNKQCDEKLHFLCLFLFFFFLSFFLSTSNDVVFLFLNSITLLRTTSLSRLISLVTIFEHRIACSARLAIALKKEKRKVYK